MIRSFLQRGALVLGAALGLIGTRPATANAQKALVYCPVNVDATGCNAIVAALTGPVFPLGVDRGYDGTGGTVDLKAVDLFTYSVFVVPSLADGAASQPYAKLRDPEVQEHLKAALIGRIAMWSGTPDQGATNRAMKDALIQNLVGWAAGAFGTARGPGLVSFLDASSGVVTRYDWVRAIAPLPVTADANLLIYNEARALNPRGTQILTSGAGPIVYTNMATFGFQVPNGAAGVSLDAVGQTGTATGGQVVLLTMEAGNTAGATVRTDKDDYAPGETVTITGSGWAAGETVRLTLHMDPLRDSDTELTAIADASGNFTNTEFVPQAYDIGVRFVLTAVGQTSGLRAQTTFTDGPTDVGISISPTTATSGSSQSYTLRIWNSSNQNNNLIGSANIAVPSGWTVTTPIALPTTGPAPSLNWTVSLVAGAIQLRAVTAGDGLDRTTGGNAADTLTVVFSATAPVVGALTAYTWALEARTNINFTGTTWTQTTANAVVNVSPAPNAATSTLVADATATYGDGSVTLNATVTSTASVNSGTVTFTVKQGAITIGVPTTSGTVTGGAASASFTIPQGTSAAVYSVDAVYNPGVGFTGSSDNTHTLTINRRNATWTTNANSKVYGNADPAPLTTGSGTFLAADNVTATYSRAAGETVLGGPYHITATLAPAGVLSNYNITNNGADFPITARPATWTTNPNSKVYGNADPVPLTAGSGSNFVAGDGVTATYTRAAGETVLGGPYEITATLAPAGVLSNYAITNAGADFTITTRPATWTTNANSKVYGNADPSPLTTGSGDFLAADGVTATYSRAAGETVLGGPYLITATLSPAAVLTNYTITNTGANFTITTRPATWTTNPNSKVYGNADPSPLTTGSGDFLAADNVTATYSRAAGETVLGGPYPITATLAPLGVLSNYSITNAGADFTITARPATWTTNPNSKVYGNADPSPLTTGSGDFLAADNVTATYSRAAGETVLGGPYPITATLAPLGVLSNYSITNAGADFTITTRPATWTTNANSKVYGNADPAPLTTGSGDFLAADGVTASYTRAAGETVLGGPYHITASLAPAGVLSNYNITNAGADFTITTRPATWTTNANSKVYGNADPSPLTTGNGDFLAADNVTATYSRAAGETVLGGPYLITATLAPAAVLTNYTITNTGANFSITARPATWTTNANSKVYGNADPSPLTTGSGDFLAADNVTATYSRAAGETVLGGPYPITATLSPAAVLTNYTITNAGANFTITTRPATWTTNPNSKVYGFADPVPLTTGSGDFLAADGVTATYSRAAGETVLGGPYAITATLAPAAVLSNYTITNAGASFTITVRPATWTTNANSKVYGFADPNPLTTGSGDFLAADNVTATYTRAVGETVFGGPYAITATLAPAAVLSNYAITNAGANFTITARPATWTTNPNSKTFGAADPVPLTTGSGSNFVASDGVSASYTRAPGETVLGSPYQITATLGATVANALDNYTITNTGAGFTINKATPVISWTGMPSSMNQGSQLTAAQLNAFAQPVTGSIPVAGTITYTLLPATPVTVGTQVFGIGPYNVQATFVSSDPNYFGNTLTKVLTVDNVAPTVTLITLPSNAIPFGSSASLTARFVDPGLTDTHTYSIDWDWDLATGMKTPGSVTTGFAAVASEPTASVAGTVNASYAYPGPGVYTVRVTVKDNGSLSGSRTSAVELFAYVIVYDASAGFVTGGGWIDSPAGACRTAACTNLTTGKANFGFVSKYKKGQTTPDGSTEFQFKAGDINFHSSVYEWLVVSGAKAQFKGTGTINGSGNYGFLLTAIDGQLNGGGGTDKFRIKIVDKDTGLVVYDNQMDAPEDGSATTALGGGSINIQAK